MRRRSDVVWRQVDGSIVVLDLRTSQYFSLNPSATVLWQLLQDDTDVDTLVDALVEREDVDRERATSDVGAFVEQLRSLRLVDD
ncbi:MAG TPA: PqqD family protein [Acidimicrobiales bacterium]|nr:PqqD family protein [Acidimicrobiales bacterium]